MKRSVTGSLLIVQPKEPWNAGPSEVGQPKALQYLENPERPQYRK